jgi:hypothetical protein
MYRKAQIVAVTKSVLVVKFLLIEWYHVLRLG